MILRTAKTESNISKQKPSTINVLEIRERLAPENEEKDCDHHHQQKVLEKITVDVSGTMCDQREQVRDLVTSNTGHVTSHQIQAHLSDKALVQQNYNSITRIK